MRSLGVSVLHRCVLHQQATTKQLEEGKKKKKKKKKKEKHLTVLHILIL
jgi:hypothetical protein